MRRPGFDNVSSIFDFDCKSDIVFMNSFNYRVGSVIAGLRLALQSVILHKLKKARNDDQQVAVVYQNQPIPQVMNPNQQASQMIYLNQH